MPALQPAVDNDKFVGIVVGMSVVGNRRIDVEVAAEMLRTGATVRQVADAFRVSTQAVYRAIKAGRLPDPEEDAA